MSKLNEYLNRVYEEEMQLPAGQAEFIGTNKGGVNAAGEIKGTNLRTLVQQIVNAYQQKNPGKMMSSVDQKNALIAWIKTKYPDVWQKIEEAGGFDRLLGNKYPPADIQISGKNEDQIVVTPDA